MGIARVASLAMTIGSADTEQFDILSRIFFGIGNHGPRLALYPLVSRCFDLGGWKLRGSDEAGITLEKDGMTLLVDQYHAHMMLSDILEWEKGYLPKFSLEGKTVLDVGSGCGETAAFYFEHGAKKVIAIDCDPSMERYLKANRDRNGWDMEIIMGPFEFGHLFLPHDFLKVDIDGGESVLVNHAHIDIGPCAIELHPSLIGVQTKKWIIEHYGLKHLNGAMWGHD